MAEQEFVSGFCPKCGEMLKVPSQLAQFSCMYCGARLSREELVFELPAAPSVPAEEAAARFDAAEGRLPECVRAFRGYQKKITKNEFEAAFAEVSAAAEPVFRALDEAFAAAGEAGGERLRKSARALLDELALDWAADRSPNGARDDDKMVIAIFLVPAVRKLALSVSEPFCEVLQAEWVERYPKSPFYLGNYDEISTGFRKKLFGLCFITTAVCEEEGKPDDCDELTAFRAFRDGYLRACPDGEALIREYYDIAPGIVTCINLASDRRETYRAIRETWLTPCYDDLQNGRLADCKDRYTQMVRTLEKRFLS